MHIAEIDQISINTKSPVHKKSAVSKLVFSLLMVASIIMSKTLLHLFLVATVLIGLFIYSRIALKRVFHLALYPAFFSLLFAVIGLGNGIEYSVMVVGKAIGAALSMLFLITTTPYIELFSIFSKVMPSVIVDVFFVTYRSFFILMEKLEHILTSVKLRGGYKKWRIGLNIKTLANVFGTVLIQSIEMSERMYKIYMLRGFNGKMPSLDLDSFKTKRDMPLIALGIIVFIGVNLSWNL